MRRRLYGVVSPCYQNVCHASALACRDQGTDASLRPASASAANARTITRASRRWTTPTCVANNQWTSEAPGQSGIGKPDPRSSRVSQWWCSMAGRPLAGFMDSWSGPARLRASSSSFSAGARVLFQAAGCALGGRFTGCVRRIAQPVRGQPLAVSAAPASRCSLMVVALYADATPMSNTAAPPTAFLGSAGRRRRCEGCSADAVRRAGCGS